MTAEMMVNTNARVTVHMAASLDGFIARKDGRVDWMETTDEFAGGSTMDPAFVESFLKTIDCYVMGSRTYETALGFEAKGLGWAYGDKPIFVLTSRDLPRTRDTVEFYSGDLAQLVNGRLRPTSVLSGLLEVVQFPESASSRTGRRSALHDSADFDWQWRSVFRKTQSRYCPPSGRGQSV